MPDDLTDFLGSLPRRRVRFDEATPESYERLYDAKDRLKAEVERLRAGEDPTPADEGTERTPGQFLHHLHQMTGGERIARLAELKYAADVGWRCILHRHEDLRRERDALKAEVEILRRDLNVWTNEADKLKAAGVGQLRTDTEETD